MLTFSVYRYLSHHNFDDILVTPLPPHRDSYEIEKDPYCLSYPGILERILHLKIELYSDLTEEQITKMSEEVRYLSIYISSKCIIHILSYYKVSN